MEENKGNPEPTTVVMSKLESDLAAERERLAAELGKKQQVDVKKYLKIGGIVLGIVTVVGVLVFFAMTSLSNIYTPGQLDPEYDKGTPEAVLPVIEGYKCTTTTCYKATDLTEHTILVRDTAYYVFDRETNKAVRTTIEPMDYRSFTPFFWKDSLLLVLERSTGRQGLYSISANRSLTTSFNYTSFDRDIKSEAYWGMEWIEGMYILAHNAGEVRLIDIQTGNELVRAAQKIFVHDFIIGYEANGQRRVYTRGGDRFLVVEAGSFIAVYEHQLIHLVGTRSMNIYSNGGVRLQSSEEFYKTLQSRLQEERLDYAVVLPWFDGVFVVPE